LCCCCSFCSFLFFPELGYDHGSGLALMLG
jgi:hypothetical protein